MNNALLQKLFQYLFDTPVPSIDVGLAHWLLAYNDAWTYENPMLVKDFLERLERLVDFAGLIEADIERIKGYEKGTA